jgi:tryptophan synthase alpha chain
VETVDRLSSGFVYAVSVAGVTGSVLSDRETIDRYLRRVKQYAVRNPVVVGFGIRTAADVVQIAQNVDGFVVGSALVSVIEELWADATISRSDRLDTLRSFAASLRPDGRGPALKDTRPADRHDRTD